MRIAASFLPALALLIQFGCEPPHEENTAPNIRLVVPENGKIEDDNRVHYPVAPNRPVPTVLVFDDVDGDPTIDLSIGVAVFDEDSGRYGESTEVFHAAEVPIQTEYSVELQPFARGNYEIHVTANDGHGVDNLRTSTYVFDVLDIVAPEISPQSPDTTDNLAGTFDVTRVPLSRVYEMEWAYRAQGSADFVSYEAQTESNSITVPASATSRGEEWRFCVTQWPAPAEGETRADWGEPQFVTCDAVTIQNTPPDTLIPSVSPNHPSTAHALFCDTTLPPHDADAGDTLTVHYSWHRGSEQHSGQWLSPEHTSGGDAWACEVRISDGELHSVSHAPAVMVEDAPQLVTPLFAPTGLSDVYTATVAVPLMTGLSNGRANIVATTTQAVGTGLVDQVFVGEDNNTARQSVIQVPHSAFMGDHLASGDLTGDGVDDLILNSDGGLWVVFSDVLSAGSTLNLIDGYGRPVLSVLDAPLGFAADVAIGNLGDSAAPAFVGSYIDDGSRNEVRLWSGISTTGSSIDKSYSSSRARVYGPGNHDRFGEVLASGGDVAGSLADDLVIADPAGVGTAVYVFEGGTAFAGLVSLADAAASITIAPDQASAEIGTSVVLADVNGDGRSDLIVGAPGYNNDRGAVGIFFGPVSGEIDFVDANALLEGPSPLARFGSHIQQVPDPSGLFGDALMVSSPGEIGGGPAQYVDIIPGYVAIRPHTDLSDSAITAEVVRFSAPSGTSRLYPAGRVAGDIDGDGHPDFLLGEVPDANPSSLKIYHTARNN